MAHCEGSGILQRWGSVGLPHSGLCGEIEFGVAQITLASRHALMVVLRRTVKGRGALRPLYTRLPKMATSSLTTGFSLGESPAYSD